jgi:hypothetical protein
VDATALPEGVDSVGALHRTCVSGGDGSQVWILRFEDERLAAVGRTSAGHPVGAWIFFNRDGMLRTSGNYCEGRPCGPWLHQVDAGVAVLPMKNGEMDGTAVLLDKANRLSETVEYRRGAIANGADDLIGQPPAQSSPNGAFD